MNSATKKATYAMNSVVLNAALVSVVLRCCIEFGPSDRGGSGAPICDARPAPDGIASSHCSPFRSSCSSTSGYRDAWGFERLPKRLTVNGPGASRSLLLLDGLEGLAVLEVHEVLGLGVVDQPGPAAGFERLHELRVQRDDAVQLAGDRALLLALGDALLVLGGVGPAALLVHHDALDPRAHLGPVAGDALEPLGGLVLLVLLRLLGGVAELLRVLLGDHQLADRLRAAEPVEGLPERRKILVRRPAERVVEQL